MDTTLSSTNFHPVDPNPSFIFSDDYICQWDSCLKTFEDAEQLYDHVRDDHVGRKANNNLCLTCKWDKCTLPTFTKRDHLTSHLRVHIASKPHHCEICKKGFKRPQDLKKHERTHQDSSSSNATALTSTSAYPSHSSIHPKPIPLQSLLPPTPPTILDHSPSMPTVSSNNSLSPYPLPISPANTADSWNPGLSSPSTNSDLFSSPSAPDLELDMLNSSLGQSGLDMTGSYYGALPNLNSGYDNMGSHTGKRQRDGLDEVLFDTIESFAMEAKKTKMDPSYNEDMIGRLNALSSILEINPLTPEQLKSSLPEVNDWNQFDQFSQFCSTLFEDVSGEVYEPQSFDSLFPEYDQKHTPSVHLGTTTDTATDFNFYGSAHNPIQADGLGYTSSSPNATIYGTVLPDDPFVPGTSALYGSTEAQPWDLSQAHTSNTAAPGVVRAAPFRNVVQQPNRFDPRYVSLPALQNTPALDHVKNEPKEELVEPKVEIKEERLFSDMTTQTQGKEVAPAPAPAPSLVSGLTMMACSSEEKKPAPIDPTILLMSAPAVPKTSLSMVQTMDDLETEENQLGLGSEQEVQDAASRSSSSSPSPGSFAAKFGNYVQKARAKQMAAVAKAEAEAKNPSAATDSAKGTQGPMDPVEAMTHQLAQTRIGGTDQKARKLSPQGDDVERQIKAAKARSLCAQDPVRKQHAEVVLNLLKSIDILMAEHRQKLAEYKAKSSGTNVYPRTTGTHVQNGGSIRTVSSYIPRGSQHPSHRPSLLNHEHPRHAQSDPDYTKLRSNLGQDNSLALSPLPAAAAAAIPSSSSSTSLPTISPSMDSPVLYPTSDLQHPSLVPFELSEEERRFIEEDSAKTAAAAARPSSAHV